MVSHWACTRLHIHFENSEATCGKTRQWAENFHANLICSLVCWMSGWTLLGWPHLALCLVFIFQDFILIPFHFLFICSMSLYSLELCSKERDVSSVLCALVWRTLWNLDIDTPWGFITYCWNRRPCLLCMEVETSTWMTPKASPCSALPVLESLWIWAQNGG